MKRTLLALAVLSTSFAATTASAFDKSFGVEGTVGTTGFGAHVVYPLSDNLNIRGGISGYNHSYSGTEGDVSYDFDLKLNTIDALFDYFPFGGGFRTTAGLVYNNNKIEVQARPNMAGEFVFNGRTYTAADAGTVDGEIEFNKVAPYLGIGWGNSVAKNKGWGFTADLGVLFQGSPKVDLESNNCDLDPFPGVTNNCGQLKNDVDREEEELRNDVKEFKYLPVVRVGVTYKF